MQNLASLIKQYGFEMPKINNGAAISRVCITPEAASQKIPTLMSQSQFGCSTKGAVQTEGGYRLDLTCDSATVKGGREHGYHPGEPREHDGANRA